MLWSLLFGFCLSGARVHGFALHAGSRISTMRDALKQDDVRDVEKAEVEEEKRGFLSDVGKAATVNLELAEAAKNFGVGFTEPAKNLGVRPAKIIATAGVAAAAVVVAGPKSLMGYLGFAAAGGIYITETVLSLMADKADRQERR